jgi:hypothetical protein
VPESEAAMAQRVDDLLVTHGLDVILRLTRLGETCAVGRLERWGRRPDGRHGPFRDPA